MIMHFKLSHGFGSSRVFSNGLSFVLINGYMKNSPSRNTSEDPNPLWLEVKQMYTRLVYPTRKLFKSKENPVSRENLNHFSL